jgi:hypothetical protein
VEDLVEKIEDYPMRVENMAVATQWVSLELLSTCGGRVPSLLLRRSARPMVAPTWTLLGLLDAIPAK